MAENGFGGWGGARGGGNGESEIVFSNVRNRRLDEHANRLSAPARRPMSEKRRKVEPPKGVARRFERGMVFRDANARIVR